MKEVSTSEPPASTLGMFVTKISTQSQTTLRSQQMDSRSNSNETDDGRQVGTCQARLTGHPPRSWYCSTVQY